MAKFIPLNGKHSNGSFAIVDDEDYEWLVSIPWYMGKNGYASHTLSLGSVDGKKHRQIIMMHRMVAMTPSGMSTDHINGNKMDNQKENLRVCDKATNNENFSLGKSNTSGYKGVKRYRSGNLWAAAIRIRGRNISLGLFDSPHKAAAVYNHISLDQRGPLCRINPIDRQMFSVEEEDKFIRGWLSARHVGRHNTSGYRGVSRLRRRGRWVAKISQESKSISLGVFDTPKEAALAYNVAAIEIRGDRAVLNPI